MGGLIYIMNDVVMIVEVVVEKDGCIFVVGFCDVVLVYNGVGIEFIDLDG